MATEWLTVKEAAELLGVAVTTMYNKAYRERIGLDSYKAGPRYVRFKRDDVERLIKLEGAPEPEYDPKEVEKAEHIRSMLRPQRLSERRE